MELSAQIRAHAERTPERTAIRFADRELSYGALAALIDALAGALVARGVSHGRAVAYLGYNSPEMLALLFACARIGALFMPLNWRLTPTEHRQLLEDCPPSVLLVEPAFVAQTDALRQSVPIAPATCVALGDAPPGWFDFATFLAAADGRAFAEPPSGLNTPLLICYTSGSTGKPKGAVLTQDALVWNSVNSVDMHDLVSDDRILTTLPLFHVGGLNNQTTPALLNGCTVVLHPKFDAGATLDAIERERITLTVLVPAQLDMLIEHPRWGSTDLSSLRMITTGSTIVPERLIHLVHSRGIPMVQVYGSTETCPIAAYLKVADARRKVGSTGKAALHCALRIVDETGAQVASGATGEILVQGRNLMAGYWNAPEATAETLVDGWFHTGDMGHLDEEGYLYVDGRKKDLIICGGENIYPAEIENVLTESPAILEAAVVGRADQRWGEIVVAVVVPAPGAKLTAEAVIGLLNDRVARFKHPRDVVFVDALPRSALGKVCKQDLRELVGGQAACECNLDIAG